MVRSVALAAMASAVVEGMGCPHANEGGAVPDSHPTYISTTGEVTRAVANVDWNALKKDLTGLMTDSESYWPADYGHYGPLLIRLAWHCAGSYRMADGRGGCDGSRIRFDPERSWGDNTNLDKARSILRPIKNKHQNVSWGDLIILAGNTAIESMGGPVLGFCAGRFDATDGSDSVQLGPSTQQEDLFPCEKDGECKGPLGGVSVGLIYVNPEGPNGVPNPEASSVDVRDTFGRMAMNDTETVALIGGGHSFGKSHGPCPNGAGDAPNVDPVNSWPGQCGNGKGVDTFTSGFEGPWTTNPIEWDNSYFTNLLGYKWSLQTGPAGKNQWYVEENSPVAPQVDGSGDVPIMMLTSDIALTEDANYRKIVELFAESPSAFDDAFAAAWYKLTTRDMGPRERCLGPDVPEAQEWQRPLPAHVEVDDKIIYAAHQALKTLIRKKDAAPLFERLAWHCASTFRSTDYQGGCNGARIRFSPEKDLPENEGKFGYAFDLLQPIKDQFDAISWADLIVLAGSTAVAGAGADDLKFCPRRSDATSGIEVPKSRLSGTKSDSASLIKDVIKVKGLTNREHVALQGGRKAFVGTKKPEITNEYFKELLKYEWIETVTEKGEVYTAHEGTATIRYNDVILVKDSEFEQYVKLYAEDNDLFLADFTAAYTKVMNADLFDGPDGTQCTDDVTLELFRYKGKGKGKGKPE